MNKSESITHLAAALAKAQAEMPVAVFDARNPFLNSRYASLGAVIQASRPILAKHKLSLVQFPVSGGSATGEFRHLTPALSPVEAERGAGRTGEHGGHGVTRPANEAAQQHRPTGEWVGVESILMHESGEFVAERILIPLIEEKGKTKVQCAGSTLTYLRRYSWAAILGMYSDEDCDGTAGTVPVGNASAPPRPKPPGNHAPRGTRPPGKMPGSTAGKMPAATLPPPPMQRFQNN